MDLCVAKRSAGGMVAYCGSPKPLVHFGSRGEGEEALSAEGEELRVCIDDGVLLVCMIEMGRLSEVDSEETRGRSRAPYI